MALLALALALAACGNDDDGAASGKKPVLTVSAAASLTEALPGRVVRHQRGDLGDREDEHQVEEQLERGYALLALHGRH